MTELKLNHKPLTEVVINGKAYPVAVTLSSERKLKAAFQKDINKLTSEADPDTMGAMLKELIFGGCRINNIPNDLQENDNEFFETIIDQQPELFGNIIATYNAAIEKRFSMTREAGNS